MPTPTIPHDVQGTLKDLEAKIAAGGAALAGGRPVEPVNAAGELAFLKDQKASLKTRLAEIEGRPEGSETVHAWWKEEVFDLGPRSQHFTARL